MLGKRLLRIACTAVVWVLFLATPASALYVRPFKAPLLDASGATNNCEAKVTEFVVTPVHQRIEADLRLTCPEEAAVRRISTQHGVWEVLDDGTLREVAPFVRTWRSTSATPLVGTFRFEVGIGSCTLPTDAGTHTWLVRARIAVKQTADNSDPNPFAARVDRKMTVTCP
jgi:hypothetical protein